MWFQEKPFKGVLYLVMLRTGWITVCVFFTQMAFTFQGPVVMNQVFLFVCWFKLCILEHTLWKSLQAVMLAVSTHTCTSYIHHFSHNWDLNIHALVFIFKISFRYGYWGIVHRSVVNRGDIVVLAYNTGLSFQWVLSLIPSHIHLYL
jgi:hypothetical protein